MRPLLLLLASAVAACGGSDKPAEPKPAEPKPAVAWAAMTRPQKLQVMKHKVMPAMEAAFTAYDAARYADFSCETCHGDGASDGSFRMPNPQLPVLHMDKQGWERMMAEQPVASRFMIDKVERGMADLLGIPPYDPDTHEGFNCLRCHTKALPP